PRPPVPPRVHRLVHSFPTRRSSDLTAFNADALFGQRHFDRVFFSYALSMIPGWERAVAKAADCLADGGSLHVVDFGEQDRLPRRSEEHTSELQSRENLVCRLLLETK